MVGTCIGAMTTGTASSALTGHRELLSLTIELGEDLLLGGGRLEINIDAHHVR